MEKVISRDNLHFDMASSFEEAMLATPQNATERVNGAMARGVLDAAGLCRSCKDERDARSYAEGRSRSELIIKNERARPVRPQWKRAAVRSSAVDNVTSCGARTGRGYTKKNGSVQWQNGGAARSERCYTPTYSRSRMSELGTSRGR